MNQTTKTTKHSCACTANGGTCNCGDNCNCGS
jgi:hypothetical protein